MSRSHRNCARCGRLVVIYFMLTVAGVFVVASESGPIGGAGVNATICNSDAPGMGRILEQIDRSHGLGWRARSGESTLLLRTLLADIGVGGVGVCQPAVNCSPRTMHADGSA
jgi:hypothetical protein